MRSSMEHPCQYSIAKARLSFPSKLRKRLRRGCTRITWTHHRQISAKRWIRLRLILLPSKRRHKKRLRKPSRKRKTRVNPGDARRALLFSRNGRFSPDGARADLRAHPCRTGGRAAPRTPWGSQARDDRRQGSGRQKAIGKGARRRSKLRKNVSPRAKRRNMQCAYRARASASTASRQT